MENWEGAYVRFRPLLMYALSRLAQKGFVTPPDEGMDLIHDFFLDAWVNVSRNHDPHRTKLETYVFASFVQFARPRIVKLTRVRAALMSPVEVSALREIVYEPVQPEEHHADLRVVRRALDSLSDRRRQLILAYLADDKTRSERALAARFSITRYKLRLELADVMGELEARIYSSDPTSSFDRSVFIGICRDHRSIKQTAHVLGVSSADVRASKERTYSCLIQAAVGDYSMTSLMQQVQEEELDQRPAVEQALDSYFRTGVLPDRTAFGDSSDVFAFLVSDDAEAFFSEHAYAESDERIAALYQWLVENFFEGEGIDEAAQQYADLSVLTDRNIGDAFANVLLNNVSPSLRSFDLLNNLPIYRDERFEYLLEDSSVIGAGSVGEALAHWHITPAIVASAMRSISNLAYRRCLESKISYGDSIAVASSSMTRTGKDLQVIEFADIALEVQMSGELPRETAHSLSLWIIDVAEYTAAIFDGFIAIREKDALILTRTKMKFGSVYEKWSYVEPVSELMQA